MERALVTRDLFGIKWYILPDYETLDHKRASQIPWWYSGSSHWPILDELTKLHIYTQIELHDDILSDLVAGVF